MSKSLLADWHHVLIVNLGFPRLDFPRKEPEGHRRVMAVVDQLETSLTGLDSVRSFAWSTTLPFTRSGAHIPYWTDRQPPPIPSEERKVQFAAIYGSYFETLSIPLLSGRAFEKSDGFNSQQVCIVNRAFADTHWPGELAVSRRITVRKVREETTLIVVGVVGNVKHESPVSDFAEKIYLPFDQAPQYYGKIILKTGALSEGTLATLKERIAVAAPNCPIEGIETLEEAIAEQLSDQLFFTRLFSVLSFAGIVLVLTGIAGLVHFSVSRRVQEIGVRVALGAQPASIIRLCLSHSLLFSLIGLLVGLGAAIGLTRYIQAWLYGLTPTDPTTLVGVSLALAVTALISAYLPARRALRLDPSQALRYE